MVHGVPDHSGYGEYGGACEETCIDKVQFPFNTGLRSCSLHACLRGLYAFDGAGGDVQIVDIERGSQEFGIVPEAL